MATRPKPREIRPQRGPQEKFLASPADVVIYGGGAGSGKTFALLLEPLRHVHRSDFRSVIFRRTSVQVRNAGGLWDQSMQLYPLVGATPKETTLEWQFRSGAVVKFAHLEHESNRLDWQGAEVPLIGWDELTHFSADSFWYLLSRNRSMSGVRPYVRATCNPDPDSFVAELVAWYVDQETGYAIPERSGVLRYFVRFGDRLLWGDSEAEVKAAWPGDPADCLPRSFTFISALLSDNPALVNANPEYRANLLALPLVERERLLHGNWKIRPAAGEIFNRAWFPVVDALPAQHNGSGPVAVRYWDKAGTKDGGDRTAGVRMVKLDGTFYVTDAAAFRAAAMERRKSMLNIASQDGADTTIWIELEPGSGGKESGESDVRAFAGYRVHLDRPTTNKVARWQPMGAQAEAGNIKLVRGPWNEDFLRELHNADGSEKVHDDLADAAAGAFNKLATLRTRSFA